MTVSDPRTRSLPIVGLALLCLLAVVPASAGDMSVIIEGGAVAARGDLARDYDTTNGYGAGLGFEVGARVRRTVSPGWDVSPVFNYAQFGGHEGVDAADAAFTSRTAAYRYGVDVRRLLGAEAGPRFFATAGVALIRNRAVYELADADPVQDGVNSVSVSLGVGVAVRNVEVTAQYHRNRFDTRRFRGGEGSWNWDHVSLRIGLVLPESF